MNIQYSFVLCLLLATGIHLSLVGQNFDWPDGKRAAISLSFDDARVSHPKVGKDLFRRLGMPVTYYVLPGPVVQHLEDWKAIVADGHEIGNHTIYHPCTGNFTWSRNKALENYSLASMRQELLAANQQIQELLGVTPVSFAYTCGNTFVGRGSDNQSYVPLIAELFESGRGWMNEAANDPGFADLALLQGIEMDGKDFAEIKPLIDQAIENGSWLLLGGHEIGEDGHQTTRIQMLEELAAYVKSRASEIWIAPVGEVAAHLKAKRLENKSNLQSALSFYSSFDNGYDADWSKGDPKIYGAVDYDHKHEVVANWIPEEVTITKGKGRFGDALEFKRKGKPVVCYQAKDHLNYTATNVAGTISLWLNLNPEKDLAPGYTDPIQITDSGYDDAALWVDFTNKNPRDFRMGVFGDVKTWNPEKKSPDDNPDFINRLVVAKDPGFQRGKWTHVAVTFAEINTQKGQASFFVDGQLQGTRSIPEPFQWDLEKAKIFVGLNYVGLIDEVAIFDRPLSPEEVKMLYELAEGLVSQ